MLHIRLHIDTPLQVVHTKVSTQFGQVMMMMQSVDALNGEQKQEVSYDATPYQLGWHSNDNVYHQKILDLVIPSEQNSL